MRELTIAEVMDRIDGADHRDIIAQINEANERGRGYGEWRIALAPRRAPPWTCGTAAESTEEPGFTTAEKLQVAYREMYIRIKDSKLCKREAV